MRVVPALLLLECSPRRRRRPIRTCRCWWRQELPSQSRMRRPLLLHRPTLERSTPNPVIRETARMVHRYHGRRPYYYCFLLKLPREWRTGLQRTSTTMVGRRREQEQQPNPPGCTGPPHRHRCCHPSKLPPAFWTMPPSRKWCHARYYYYW